MIDNDNFHKKINVKNIFQMICEIDTSSTPLQNNKINETHVVNRRRRCLDSTVKMFLSSKCTPAEHKPDNSATSTEST